MVKVDDLFLTKSYLLYEVQAENFIITQPGKC